MRIKYCNIYSAPNFPPHPNPLPRNTRGEGTEKIPVSLLQSEHESQSLSDPQGAEDLLLVAYLDGELDEKEKSAFEKQLAEQPQLRQKLAEYEKAWKALDYLEPSTPDQAKVYSTLELIALRAKKEAESLAVVEKKTKYRNGILTLIGLFLVAGLGYLTVNQSESQPDL